MHLAGYGGGAPRSSPGGDPTTDVLFGPMIGQRFYDRFNDWLALIRPHHSVYGSTGTGRITRDNPRLGFVGDPDAGLFVHPTIVDGGRAEDGLSGCVVSGAIH